MTVSEKIKARIAYLKSAIDRTEQDRHDQHSFEYDDGMIDTMDREIDFLVVVLDDIERMALKEK
jgi:hypothetical protein